MKTQGKNKKKNQKCGKTRATKSRSVFVWHLIGLEHRAGFLNLSLNGVKQSQGNPDYIRHSIENCRKVSIVRSSAHLILETI